MTAPASLCCPACGFDSAAIVARSWSFFVEADAKSMNRRLVNAGPSRFAYAKERDAWMWRIRAATTGDLDLRTATRFRRLTLTRHFTGRQRPFDDDNLRGGMKHVVDAIVRCGVLVDDDAKHAQIIYKQAKQSPIGVAFVVEELADG